MNAATPTTVEEPGATGTSGSEEKPIHILWSNAGPSWDGDPAALTAAVQPSIEERALQGCQVCRRPRHGPWTRSRGGATRETRSLPAAGRRGDSTTGDSTAHRTRLPHEQLTKGTARTMATTTTGGRTGPAETTWDPITRIVDDLGIHTKTDFKQKRVAECYSASSVFRGHSVFMRGFDFFHEALPGYGEAGRRRVPPGCWGALDHFQPDKAEALEDA